jgi:hypothetical protein
VPAETNQSAKGNAFEELKSGKSKTLLEIQGAGIIQRMWFTVRDRSPEMIRSLRLRMYWDGESKPAVDVPFGDFFGFGLSQVVKFETALFSNPEGRSFNCMIPMPFRKGARVVITNESPKNIAEVFFDIDFVTMERLDDDALYFHAYWTRQKSPELGKDFEFLPVIKGKGRFLGVNFGVNADTSYGSTWWGEGEVKMYIDNDREYPTFNGTGTEDYIGTAWGQGRCRSLPGLHRCQRKEERICLLPLPHPRCNRFSSELQGLYTADRRRHAGNREGIAEKKREVDSGFGGLGRWFQTPSGQSERYL